LTVGAVFLAAAAVFHLLATPHIAAILRKMLDAKVYGFLEPILSFVFVLNAILLLPLSLITFISAAGVRRGERWAWWIALINALTILALPCTIRAAFRSGAMLSRNARVPGSRSSPCECRTTARETTPHRPAGAGTVESHWPAFAHDLARGVTVAARRCGHRSGRRSAPLSTQDQRVTPHLSQVHDFR
jgi:hypothetical protein